MIQPALGTNAYKIGEKYSDIDFTNVEIEEVESRGKLVVHKSREIWFFFNKETEELDQLSFFAPYSGKVLEKVGIGDTLDDVLNFFGSCSNNDRVFEPFDYPGVVFEADETAERVSIRKISSISVCNPNKFYGELPDHIKNNLPGKNRKLP